MPIFGKRQEEQNNQPAQAEPASGEANSSDLDSSIRNRVEPIIAQLRPYLQADGGDIELVGVEDAVVYVRLQGACCGCPSSIYTLKMGVEARIIEEIPEVRSVEMA